MFQCVRGEATGIQFIDATTLEVCKIPRASRHKVFEDLAHKSKTEVGWFFGFKLHTLINHKVEIMAITITAGNVDDRTPVLHIVEGMFGKLLADKGYISAKFTRKPTEQWIHLVTRIKKI